MTFKRRQLSVYRTPALFRSAAVMVFVLVCSWRSLALQNKSVPEQYEVNSITLKVDGPTSNGVFRDILQTVETPARFWTFLYNNVYKKLGSKPEYFDPILFDGDVIRLRQYLKDNGYTHAEVDTSLRFDPSEKRVDLDIVIRENRRSIIDTLSVIGVDSLPAEVKKEIFDGLLVKQGSPFIKDAIEQERLRVLRILLNNGYTYAGIDSVTAVRFYSTDNYSVKFWYRPGERYVFGPVDIHVNQRDVDSAIIIRELDFTPGQVYSEEKKMDSEQNLNRLGLFESAKVEAQSPLDTMKPPAIPIRILLRSRELQEVTPEVLIDDENSTLNTGLGLGYDHRNFYGDARSLSARMRFRLESIDNLNLSGVFKEGLSEPTLLTNSDLQMQMVQPYFFSNKASASWTVSTEYEKQIYYTLNTLTNRIGFSNKFSSSTAGFVDWNLERVGVSISDTTQVNPADFTGTREKQFNSILTLTLQQDKTNDVFSPSLGFFRSISVEEAGVIPKLLNSFGSGLPYSEYY
ncbi:MAG: POTRA domain-containing protein, partial [Bacteroidota bacterium]